MAKYKISGVWKENGAITHYAFHIVTETGIKKGTKTTKSEAVKILNTLGNEAVTWLWDYKTCLWKDGEKVIVIDGTYLRSTADGTVRDNLAHLINYNSI